MAGSTQIAGANVALTVNADQMVRGLKKAEGDVRDFKKKSEGVWTKIGEKFGGGGGGFIAKALGAGFFGGIAGSVAIKALNFLADGISDVWSQQAKWTQELERTNFQMGMMEAHADRMLAVRDEWTAVAGPESKRARLGFDEGEARRGKESALAEAERLRQRLELINSFGLTNTGLAISGDLDREKAFATAELARAEKAAEKYAARLDEVGEKIKRLDPASDPAVKAGIDSFVRELEAQIATLGLTADEARLKLVEMKGGARGDLDRARKVAAEGSDAKALQSAKEFAKEVEKQFDAMQKGAASAERLKLIEMQKKDISVEYADELKKAAVYVERMEFNKKNAEAREFLESLQLQRTTLGWTANEAKLLELRMAGTSKALIESLSVEAAFADVMEKKKHLIPFEPKFAGAMLANSQEAYSLEMKHRFGQAADPNKGATMFDVVQAIINSKKTLDKIEGKLKPAGAF